jgi:site-specific recombinase XerD
MKSEYVFTTESGNGPMKPLSFKKKVFYPAREKADIKDFRWHDLRHTFGSRLVMKGTDIRTVQELMGHKDISMTMRYAHLAPRHLREAVEQVPWFRSWLQRSSSCRGIL